MSVTLAKIVVIEQCCHDCGSLQLVVLAIDAHMGSAKPLNRSFVSNPSLKMKMKGTLLALAAQSVLPQDSITG